MRFNKKSIATITIVLGTVIFATSAFADMALGSAYGNLKNAVKNTSKSLSKSVDNFTIDASFSFKVDGKVIEEESAVSKFNNKTGESESIQKGTSGGYYSYNSKTKNIYKSDTDDSYYVNLRSYNSSDDSEDYELVEDVFDEEKMVDAEKIVDALVGTLKEVVQVEEKDDVKTYIATLTETQVPPLVNAVSSFAVKYGVLESYKYKEDVKFPMVDSDIYVKEASMKVIENADGIIEYGTGVISILGKDEAGNQHTYSLEFMASFKDIGSTTVTEPDLSNEEVVENHYDDRGGYMFDSKYVGTYKKQVIEQKDGVFVLTGEKTLEITSIEDGIITANFSEIEDGEVVNTYTITGTDKKGEQTQITCTDQDGVTITGTMGITGEYAQNLYVSFDSQTDSKESQWIEFIRVLN